MQFIENTRSTSSLIEYFRHFFIDYVHFRTPRRRAFRRRRQSGVEPACPPRRASGRQAAPQERSGRKDGAALRKKSPTLTKRAWGTRKRTPSCARRGRGKPRPYKGKPHAQKNEHGAPGKANGLCLPSCVRTPSPPGGLAAGGTKAMGTPERAALARTMRE